MEYVLTAVVGLYTFSSCVNAYFKYDALANHGDGIDTIRDDVEGVDIKMFEKTEDIPPVYVQTSLGVGIPIGGGTISENKKDLFDVFQMCNSKESLGGDYICTDTHTDFHYVNKMNQLDEILDKYQVDNQIMVTLPLMVYNYRLKSPVYKITRMKGCRVIGTNRMAVISKYVMKSRYPFSFTAATAFVVGTTIWSFNTIKRKGYKTEGLEGP